MRQRDFTARVRVQVKDVVDYYGHSKDEKARMRRVANSIIQRCRIAFRLQAEARRLNEHRRR